ncbi:MAG: phytanoyl-CoA dioxygenase family protein, partial [Pseudomonadota bacterium]
KQRYHYSGDDLVMDDLRDGKESWDLSRAVPLEASAGSLVILHGLLPHFSGANTSAKSRMAYTLHVIDQNAEWSDDNWLRRAEDMPVRGF